MNKRIEFISFDEFQKLYKSCINKICKIVNDA